MVTKIKILFIFCIFSLALVSCKKDNDNNPDSQDIVNEDNSELTGKLNVKVYYNNGNGAVVAPSGVVVSLYASTQDIQYGYSMFDVSTNSSGVAYFGYVNIGNYYVVSTANIGNVNYQGIDMVQVRPRRDEILNMTMLPK